MQSYRRARWKLGRMCLILLIFLIDCSFRVAHQCCGKMCFRLIDYHAFCLDCMEMILVEIGGIFAQFVKEFTFVQYNEECHIPKNDRTRNHGKSLPSNNH